MLLAQAITEATTVTISLKVLGTMVGFALSLVGVYVSAMRRSDRLDSRIEDLESWLEEEFKGGPTRRGGHQQFLEKMRSWYQRERGRREAHQESKSNKHKTLGPGHDTIT